VQKELNVLEYGHISDNYSKRDNKMSIILEDDNDSYNDSYNDNSNVKLYDRYLTQMK
jgi:hypothetical protein